MTLAATGKKPSMAELLDWLREEQKGSFDQPSLEDRAAQEEAAGHMGMAIHYRSLLSHSRILYGWLLGNGTREVFADRERQALERDIEQVDDENLQYRIALAQAQLDVERAA